MTTQLLEENPHPSDDDIKHYLSGNLCRCGAYPEILDAVRSLAAAAPVPRSKPTP
jgi:aerobic-type carbon monoxide dehydrogenase small subunit (CoxS/CutS family)